MKRTLLMMLLASFVNVAQASELRTIICKEELPVTPYEVLRSRLVIRIEEQENISSIIKEDLEYGFLSKVDISREMENGSDRKLLKSFSAISLNSDVYYQVSSEKNGLAMNLYLDEMEEASASLKLDGKNLDLELTCEYEE